MDTLRSKNSFDFESDDSNIPYIVEKVFVGIQRVSAFNYSSELFRYKQSSDKGIYQIIGGNIPSDMSSGGSSYSSEEGNLSCGTISGTGRAARPLTVLNLTPNKIFDWNYDPTCHPEKNPPADANLPPPKEEGKGQKPNHMYIPTYQHSCSDHPRAKGFAHEDHYNCLKYFKGQPTPDWYQQKKCCVDGCSCLAGVKIFTKLNGKYVPLGTNHGTFSCLTQDGVNKYPEICGNKPSCSAGYYAVGACGGNRCLDANTPCTFYGNCPDKGGDYRLTDTTLYIKYTFSASEGGDCGCKKDSPVTVSRQECSRCVYCNIKGGNQVIEYNCGGSSGGSERFCGCVFQSEEQFGTVSTLEDPNFPFPNWSRLDFVGDTIAPVPCDRQFLTCDDVS